MTPSSLRRIFAPRAFALVAVSMAACAPENLGRSFGLPIDVPTSDAASSEDAFEETATTMPDASSFTEAAVVEDARVFAPDATPSVDATGPVDAMVPVDVAPRVDVTVDAPLAVDAVAPVDAPIAVDASVPEAAVAVDAPPPPDAPRPVDAPVLVDAPAPTCSFVGTFSFASPIGTRLYLRMRPDGRWAYAGSTSSLDGTSLYGTYTVTGDQISIRETGASLEGCSASSVGTYRVAFNTACSVATLARLSDPCSLRGALMGGRSFTRIGP